MAEQYLKTNVFRRSKDVSKEGKEGWVLVHFLILLFVNYCCIFAEENENTMKATTTSEPVQVFCLS